MRYLTDDVKNALAITLCTLVAFILYALYPIVTLWCVLTALTVGYLIRTSTLQSGLLFTLCLLIVSIFIFNIIKYITHFEIFIIYSVTFVVVSFLLWLQIETSRKQLIFYAYLPIIMLVMILDFKNYASLKDIIFNVVLGSSIAIVGSYFVAPVIIGDRFKKDAKKAILFIKTEMLKQSDRINQLISTRAHVDYLSNIGGGIHNAFQWVFAKGLNIGVRSSFRYFVIKVEEINDFIISNHLLLNHLAVDNLDLPLEALKKVVQNNIELLTVLENFFSNTKYRTELTSFIKDIEELEAAHQEFTKKRPASLKTSEDIYLAVLIDNMKEIRKTLLSLLSSIEPHFIALNE